MRQAYDYWQDQPGRCREPQDGTLQQTGPMRTHVETASALAQNPIQRRVPCRVAINGRPQRRRVHETLAHRRDGARHAENRHGRAMPGRRSFYRRARQSCSEGVSALADARASRSLPAWARCGAQLNQTSPIGAGASVQVGPPGRGTCPLHSWARAQAPQFMAACATFAYAISPHGTWVLAAASANPLSRLP